MATAPEALVELIGNAARAAQSAAEAAQLMKEASEAKSRNNFSEASKVVKCPEFFGYPTADEDQNTWRDFSFAFKAWLVFADSNYEDEMKQIEDTSDKVYSVPTNAETLQRSHKLYAILSGLLRHRPLRIHKQVLDRNGFETWRQLCQLYAPRTKSRSISLLQALMSFPAFDKSRTLLEQIQSLERVRDEYQRSTGAVLSDDIMTSTLLRVLPKNIQQRLHLQMTATTDYASVHGMVLNYEIASSSFSTNRIHAELGVVTSYAQPTGPGPTPMEIDNIQEYKGKSKGKHKGKTKGKQKGASKGKGKVGDFSKKGKSKGDGNKGKGKSQAVSIDTCRYCHKVGHWEKDCRKLKRDQANQVRQVGTEGSPSANSPSVSASSAAAFSVDPSTTYRSSTVSSGNPAGSSVRRVAFIDALDECEDLTCFQTFESNSNHVCVISMKHLDSLDIDQFEPQSPVPCFDMTYSDDDSAWSWCDCADSCVGCDVEPFHVPAISDQPIEIVLDSGADISALPLSFANIGKSCQQSRDSSFIDAQGGQLNVRDIRVGKVQLGDVAFKERFIIADVTTPLLALGSIVRAGWSLRADGSQQYSTKGNKTIEVLFKRNSLCALGTISQIAEVESLDSCASPSAPQSPSSSNVVQVSAITLKPVLRFLRPGWNVLGPQLYAISTFAPRHVDSTTAPSSELMWVRTTVVKGRGVWELDEFAQPIADVPDLRAPLTNPDGAEEVITLAHVFVVPPEDLGINMPLEELPVLGRDAVAGDVVFPAAYVPVAVDVQAQAEEMQVPAAEGAEAPPQDRDPAFEPESDVVVVDGVRFTADNTLKQLRTACEALGLGKSGSKKACMKRMIEHIKSQELIAAQSATAKVHGESRRSPIEQRVPVTPTQQMIDEHNLTHEPFADWCPLCISHRSRQDGHSKDGEQGLRAQHSVVSWDFGFCSRTEGDENKLTVLFLHDSATGLLGVVPTPQKGGKHLSYLTTEITRFITQTGHTDIGLRCDGEPSTLTLLSSVRKTCQALGIATHEEPTPIGDHQANGGAEVAVRLLRSHASILVSQVEQACGCTEPVVNCLHPFYAWALLHSAWVHNHYKVCAGQTAFEACSGRTYSGKVAMYGERVYAFLKSDKKAKPQWQPGLWLGKTVQGDCHIVSTSAGILVTRSIRRLPKPFVLEMIGECTIAPWECGYAALGHKMLHAKRLVDPTPTALSIDPPPPQAPAALQDEAASDPPSPRVEIPDVLEDMLGNGSRNAPETEAVKPSRNAPETEAVKPSRSAPETEAVKLEGGAPKSEPSRPRKMTPPPPTAAISGQAGMHANVSGGGSSSSAAPMDESSRPEREAVQTEESDRPEKQLKINALTDLATSSDFSFDEFHEDGKPALTFQHDTLDDLEAYDMDLHEEEWEDDADDALMNEDAERMKQELIFPFSKDEPNVDALELQRLDAIADQLEIVRLKGLEVLCDPAILEGSSFKTLSTRFVRTWRAKTLDGRQCWLRRSRFVAREFAWLSDSKENMFSPASSSVAHRILPAMYLKHQHDNWGMYAIDIADAFLTVKQREPTLVHAEDAAGLRVSYALGQVLPGQRSGSMLWHEDLTNHLKEHAGLIECECYPSILKSPCGECFVLLHVDDLLVTGSKRFVNEVLLPGLQTKYKTSVEKMESPGDELSFLKRNHVLLGNGRMLIQSHHKHFTQLHEIRFATLPTCDSVSCNSNEQSH